MEIKLEIPHLGQMVVVRGRAGIVEDINRFPTKEEILYAVEVRYIDGWSFPDRDTVIWQRERNPKVIKGALLPKILKTSPDSKKNFYNFINAYRWSTVNKVTVNDDEENINFIAPWQSAIQVEDYQLYPLLKALLMPRISLLLADDVGLGKTIEAGLIMSELVARGRLKRVLIICPASLQFQWKDELKEKFNLDFEIIDRKKSIEMKREFGINTNQWTIYPRIITSMDYIRQPDVKEKFKAACEILKINEAKMPWNMLVVDEAHNFSPNIFGESSQRYETLKEIGSKFEHKMFLTATPHNGYTYSFTGLLELLDPVRFSQIDSINEEYKKHIDNVMIRRLKKDLNTKSKQRFANRTVESININLNYKEAELFNILRQYKKYGMEKLQEVGKKESQLGQFMFNLLNKRLLSDPYAFACTWWNKIYNNLDDDISIDEVKYIYKKVESLTEDDVERDERELELILKGSKWINALGVKNDDYIRKINKLLDDIGFSEENINKPLEKWNYMPYTSKIIKVIEFIKNNICIEGNYLKEERVIIFTEYKQTLNYIKEILKRNEIVEPYIDILFGGMNTKERQLLKERFNSEDSNLKILLATDAASEGINLQNGCRYILHYDIPWNPMRMEQRNGRIDRHGQQRDVFIYHFTSDDDIDLSFLDKVVNKINQVREDLGSVSQVIDGIVQNHFNNEEAKNNIDNVNLIKLKTTLKTNVKEIENIKAYQRLKATELNLKLNEVNLYNLLSYSLKNDGGNIDEVEKGIYRITKVPPTWKNIINESLKIEKGNLVGLPKITFNPEQFKKEVNGREFYVNREDTVLMRLAHPMMQKAILDIKKELWDSNSLNRWTVLKSNLPHGIDSIVKMFILVEVVNALGERIHQEIIEEYYQIIGDELIELEHELILEINSLETKEINNLLYEIDFLCEIEDELIDNLTYKYRRIKKNKEVELVKIFSDKYALEIEKQKALYDERLQSLKNDKIQKKLNKINQNIGIEYSKLYGPDQIGFFNNASEITRDNIKKLQKEKEILEINIDATRELLKEEKNTVLKSILPKKYKISNCEVWPLGIEIIVSS